MKRKVIVIIGLFMLIYFALHSTPTLAVRTALFFEGHPKVATGGEITKERNIEKEALPVAYQTLYGTENNEPDHYFFPQVQAHGTGIDMMSACVKKKWFFYKAELGCY
ncbi:hypothetical protein BHU24_12355 [Bacillus pseudomycoides]|uniref:Uncharacterized protein n=1 Tax=Bacillus pseudomycoides TaxID=64104 RepID=A0AAJ1Z0T8_9BACI|nr:MULTISPECIES: hypothetical protein [Bacillus cereus group]MBD5798560.1 hypothetical protein [Bacillus pseudomycoides]MBJ8029644.1 hypothetical protein [Bacillus cereus group sp. N21]MCR8860859.1 hypothetical protein [Bacillus pseudomycoides]MDR4327780.1 hypothetical protein [Bacillus pseudomycoides]MED1477903.1 hypothetical protein [Bacillus pseudomycoides]